jgi:glutathione S-transferase
MTTYRLHYFPESGNSYKLALMLTLCGQKFEPVWTDFGGGVTRTADWRRDINKMGEIPVLEESGIRRTQTAPILLLLAKRYDRFNGIDDNEQFEILRWLFWDNHKLTGYMATYRYQRAFMPSPDSAVLTFMRKRIDDYLAILEKHLHDRTFMVGNRPTVADLSIVGYLFFSSRGERIRFLHQPSGCACVARSSRGFARLARALRPTAWYAFAPLSIKNRYVRAPGIRRSERVDSHPIWLPSPVKSGHLREIRLPLQ